MTTHVARMTMHPTFTRSDDLRVQAESCRQLAELALNDRNRLFWLRLAAEWAELAVDADRQEVRKTISARTRQGAPGAPNPQAA
jgi:hypothetical protein